LPNISRKGRRWGARWGIARINLPNLGAATLWRAALAALLVWAAGGLLHGATLGELVGVPMLVAAWMSAVVLIDRSIMRWHRGWSINSAD
jgi:hypothetical protein